ncbi:hypothetical protein ACOSQ3_009963 [Xanthoceras sorbifolium]
MARDICMDPNLVYDTAHPLKHAVLPLYGRGINVGKYIHETMEHLNLQDLVALDM